MDDYTLEDMVANILLKSQIVMARGLICGRKCSVMNWAFFPTWMKKEQVHRLLVSKRGFLGSKQVLNLDEEEAKNLDAKGKPMENRILVILP
jgi:hypothetical protein